MNITPDSFSDGGDFLSPNAAFAQAEKLWQEGADFVDIGAESTRPGSAEVVEMEEWYRLEPVLRSLNDLSFAAEFRLIRVNFRSCGEQQN